MTRRGSVGKLPPRGPGSNVSNGNDCVNESEKRPLVNMLVRNVYDVRWKKTPNPPRTAERPSPPGAHVNPSRGAMLFRSVG